MRFGILTVSTTSFLNPEKDLTGPRLENEINQVFPDSDVTYKQIVTDQKEAISTVLTKVAGLSICDVLFTVGGTGFSPSDVTPEATKAVIEKEAPGLAYALISKSLKVTDMAMLSRAVCGIKNETIIINFPGSPKAAVECFYFVKHALPHAVALLHEDDVKVKKEHKQIQQALSSASSESNALPHVVALLHEDDVKVKEEHKQIQQALSSTSSESKVKIKAGASRVRQSQFAMVEVADAIDIIFKIVTVINDSEEVPIEDAYTRILGQDIRALHPVPAFPASIKDGYAVRAAEGAGHRKVRSVTAAGDAPDDKKLQPGEIVRISTGAAIPAGADAVVQVEDTTLIEVSENGEDELVVNIEIAPMVGQDIRKIGSDIPENIVVLQKSSEINAAHIGVLAMLGYSRVKVVKRPSIGVISTGNELVSTKEPLKPGLIHDANKISLITLLKSYGYDGRDCGIARDNPNSVKTILENAFKNNDFIISSGGVSMGEYDLIKQVLVEDFNAVIHFGRINMKPGKPTVFATLQFEGKTKLVFSLPGNPVSCFVTSLLFVIPTLRYIENNKSFNGWPIVEVTLDHEIVNYDSRPEYVRIRISRDCNKKLVASSTGKQISSRLNSMVDANGLLLISRKTRLEKGHVTNKASPVYLFGSLF